MKAIMNNIMRPLLCGAMVWTLSLGCQSAIAAARGIEGNIYDAFDNRLFEELSIELTSRG